MSPRRRGRGGPRGRRPENGGHEPPPGSEPQQGRGGRPHNGRAGRPPEPAADEHPDDAELLEEEIRAHREIAADARPAVAASPEAVQSLSAFLRSLGIDSRRDPEYTVTAQLTADFLAERTAALRREPGPIRPSRYRGQPGETVRLERIPLYGMCPHH